MEDVFLLKKEIVELEKRIKLAQEECDHDWEETGHWDDDDGYSVCTYEYGVYRACVHCDKRERYVEGRRLCNR
jgi:hypothetical protein